MPGDEAPAAAPRTVTFADLHLVAQGRRLEPELRGQVHVFHLTLPSGDLRLVSRYGRPADLGINGDLRQLGVFLSGLRLVQGDATIPIPLDHPDLGEGLHAVEERGLRWTTGDALLPGHLLDGAPGPAELHVAARALARYAAPETGDAALFARFAALGDDCELGLVQREFGAEPMDLLRWAGTDIARVILGLCRRFEGLGDPARTELRFREDTGEYRLRDAHYLGMHTWSFGRLADTAEEESMRLAGAARMRLLRRKLLAEIEEGQRILVFASSKHALQPEAFTALHAALRGIGPAPLLYVVPAPAPALVGRVERLGDGLYRGCIDRFMTVRTGVSHGTWRRLCRGAAAMVDADRPTPAQP
jgi:hypothetical protein